jgi:hypothetical protein
VIVKANSIRKSTRGLNQFLGKKWRWKYWEPKDYHKEHEENKRCNLWRFDRTENHPRKHDQRRLNTSTSRRGIQG